MHELQEPSDEVPFGEGSPGPATIYVMWVGDAVSAQRLVGRRAPHIRIEETAAIDASVRLRSPDARPDLIVVDATLPSMDSMRVLDLFETDAVDLPLVLLTPPGNDSLPSRAARLGACDCIVKTPDFVHQLLPTITQVRARHYLLSVLRAGRQSDESFFKSAVEPVQEALRQAQTERDLAVTERQIAEAQQQDANRHVMTALRDAELERERLSDELQSLKATLEALTEQAKTNSELEAERDRLRSDLQAAQAAPVIDPADREQMTAALDMAHARSQALADTIDRLEAALTEATGRQQQDGDALARIELENRSLREELMRAGEESRALGAEAQAGRDELLALRTSHDTQRAAFESQQIAIDALQSERDELEGRLRDAVAQCATIFAEREEWARARHDARAAHAAAILELETERDRLAQAVLAADERSAALAQAGREAAAAASSGATDDLRRELQAADSRCQHLVERLAEAQAAADQSEAGRVALAELLAVADRRLTELTAIGRSLQAGHDDVNGLRQALTRFLVDADIRCKAIATRHTDLLASLDLPSDRT